MFTLRRIQQVGMATGRTWIGLYIIRLRPYGKSDFKSKSDSDSGHPIPTPIRLKIRTSDSESESDLTYFLPNFFFYNRIVFYNTII